MRPFLRERPPDLDAQLADARAALAGADDPRARARARLRLGDLLRIAGRPGEALVHLVPARQWAQRVDDADLLRKVTLAVAIAQQFDGDHVTAIAGMRTLLAELDDGDPLTSFVHQHLGKALVEAGDRGAGRAHIERALELRRDGPPGPRASSERALDALQPG